MGTARSRSLVIRAFCLGFIVSWAVAQWAYPDRPLWGIH